MHPSNSISGSLILVLLALICMATPVYSGGDTCMFEVSADDMPPNVVLLLDNGAEMKHAIWHGDFDNSVDYTPEFDGSTVWIASVYNYPGDDPSKHFAVGEIVQGYDSLATAAVVSVKWTGADQAEIILSDLNGAFNDDEKIIGQSNPAHQADLIGNLQENAAIPKDVVSYGADGNGFFNTNGYGIYQTAGSYYLVPVGADLKLDTTLRFQETGGKASHTWTINAKTVSLPAEASNKADGDGIIDNAGFFRYSKNYLNWLFFSGNYTGNGSDLPAKSRFYYAKKALLTAGKRTSNKALFAIYNFTSTPQGASNVQPIGEVVATLAADSSNNILDSSYVNNINNMTTVTYSPLAEGLASIGNYIDSDSFGKVDATNFCQKNFVIIVSPGLSSEDKSGSNQAIPGTLDDYDADGTDGIGAGGPGQGTLTVDGVDHTIVTNINGSTYLDDVAHYLYTHDMRVSNDEIGGFQNVFTYTVGFMATAQSRLFLINTSNNGNGNFNLTDSSHPEYGKYHFMAQSADGLSQAILNAVNEILSRVNTFVAPVVPVTRTTSGDKIYMAFFTPSDENFWQGYVNKFGLDSQNEIMDANGNPATWANGAIKEDAVPYWTTKDWADTSKGNGIDNAGRKIYTYLGAHPDLTNPANEFAAGNSNLTALILANPTDISVNGTDVNGKDKVIQYIRGADVLDEDHDGDTSENRSAITGDVLHSKPLVFTYHYANNSAKSMVFFGANDGMLHAVLDQTDPNVLQADDETHWGTEAWAFIPPEQLSRLKFILEGASHSDYVDASPKAYFHDVDEDRLVDPADGDKVILICGERKGGTSYFALDITDPDLPKYLWRIGSGNDSQTGVVELDSITRYGGGAFRNGDTLRLWNFAGEWHDAAAVVGDESGNVLITYDARTLAFAVNDWLGNLTTAMYEDYMAGNPTAAFVLGRIVSMTNTDPEVIIPELGQSWSEPEFARVKTSDLDSTGTAVFFIGGGYSADNSAGKAVVAVNVFTGEVVRKFTLESADTADLSHTTDTAMSYSVPSSVKVIDENDNGFADKVYVGDLGGQIWRFGQVTQDPIGNSLTFPECDENINNWTGQILFSAPTYLVDATTHRRKFFYPPSVTFENDFDLVFIGTGDRESACSTTTAADRIYCVKDAHGPTTLTETDLVNITDTAVQPPDLDHENGDVDLNGVSDQGWYIELVDAAGEKILAKGTVYYKTLYISSFTPNNDPCYPGGIGKLYAVNYLTGQAVLFTGDDTDGDGVLDLTRSIAIGGGIPSRPVMVIQPRGQKLLISVGSTNPEVTSQSLEAGVVGVDPLVPKRNFYRIWWRQLFS